MPDGILYFLNLNLSVSKSDLGALSHLRQSSLEQSQQQFSATFIFFFFFSQRAPPKILHRVWTEYFNMIHKNSKRYWGAPSSSSATMGKYEKLNLLDTLKIHFLGFSVLSFLYLISNGLNRVNIDSLRWILALL